MPALRGELKVDQLQGAEELRVTYVVVKAMGNSSEAACVLGKDSLVCVNFFFAEVLLGDGWGFFVRVVMVTHFFLTVFGDVEVELFFSSLFYGFIFTDYVPK